MFRFIEMKRLLFSFAVLLASVVQADERPNILWLYVDDMSDWLGCYGYELAETPHIDQLAKQGVRFEKAFMPSPVCSTTRSALITGTMQTSFGLHHHRTMIKEVLPNEVLTVPELFRQAGYVTFNEEKEDYNFLRDRDLLYSPDFQRPKFRGHFNGKDLDWLKQLQGKPFFGQIQLKGGKTGGETGQKFPTESRVKAEQVTVPPFYPDNEVFRNAIARHYEQVAITDTEVGQIINALKEYDLLDNTILFFFTDHGSPLPRAKQFLYDDGLKVPLIVTGKNIPKGAVREDLVNGIDISATSLALAGVQIPDYLEGKDLFATDYEPQQFVIGARDRCGIAVDRIRSVRSDNFRYIRNFLTDRAFYQPQYRDKHATIVNLRKLYKNSELTPLQAGYHHEAGRAAEELYDLASDPDQINNLVNDPKFESELEAHRKILAEWMANTKDKGQVAASREELKAVYDHAKGKVASPEFDFLKAKEQ